MVSSVQVRRLGSVLLVLSWLGCQTLPREAPADRSQVKVELVFVEGAGHPIGACLKEYGQNLVDWPDGVLFYDRDRDPRIRVTPPRGPHAEPVHVHLLHRVGGELMDYVLSQGENGLIDLDLRRFDQPEKLVISTAGWRAREKESGVHEIGSGQAKRPPAAPLPPYSISFRLLPWDQAEVVGSLQNFRRDIQTELGTLWFFVQAFNRGDMMLTWLDRTRSLDVLIKEDPYIYVRPGDGYVPPRLVVDVLEGRSGGKLVQRSGTWFIPDTVVDHRPGKTNPKADEQPFVLRTPRRELIAFGPPPRVDFSLPEDPPATTARLTARFAGLRRTDALRLVLAAQVPTTRDPENFSVRLQSKEIIHETQTESFLVDLSDFDRFPVTTAVSHRFTQPWVVQGGRYNPQPPIAVANVSLRGGELPKLHAKIAAPRYASHYDWISFWGSDRAGKDRTSLADLYWSGPFGGGPPNGPSPNLAPPPPGPVGPPPGGLPPGPGTPPAGQNPAAGQGGGGFGGGGGGPGGGGGGGNGDITLNLFCSPKPQGCGHDPANCKCNPHLWTMQDVMGIIVPAFPGACDFAWAGLHGAHVPCHQKTPIGNVRVSFWGQGFHLIQKWYSVSVVFGPCVGKKGPPPVGGGGGGLGKPEVGQPKPENGAGGSLAVTLPGQLTLTEPLTGDGTPPTAGLTSWTGTSSATPYNDPNLILRATDVASALGSWTGATNWVDTGALHLDDATLYGILNAANTWQNAYWQRGDRVMAPFFGLDANAVPLSPHHPANGSPSTVPSTTTTTPPPPPTSTKPTRT
jgi:hypothetical protein